jgi:uncharacterized protein (TIGR03437 family)
MGRRISILWLLAAPLLAASDFQDFQAARAVLGQASFSSHGRGVVAHDLSLSHGDLYAADVSGQVLAFDLSRIGSASSMCPVCVASPRSSVAQNVFEGVGAVAVDGPRIAIADASAGRVLLWRSSSPRGSSPMDKPDVVLSGFLNPTSVALDGQRLFVGDAGAHHVFIWNALPASNSQVPDVVLGSLDAAGAPGPDTIQTPTALLSDGKNLFVADASAARILVFSAADSAAPQVLNAATLGSGPVAPGTLLMLDHILAAGSAVEAFLNGSPLRVTESNGDHLQVQVPYDLASADAGSLWVQMELDNGAVSISRPAAVRFTTTSPGIFAFGVREPRTGLMLHDPGGIPLSPEEPAHPGELLTVWATGLGAVAMEANSDGSFDALTPVRATLNGTPVEVVSASLPAEATGVYEVRLRLPADLPPSPTLTLFQNESKSNTVTFPVEMNH